MAKTDGSDVPSVVGMFQQHPIPIAEKDFDPTQMEDIVAIGGHYITQGSAGRPYTGVDELTKKGYICYGVYFVIVSPSNHSFQQTVNALMCKPKKP